MKRSPVLLPAFLASIGLGLGGAGVSHVGGPQEAWAILRLDGIHAIPLEPLGMSTCYTPDFSHVSFRTVSKGESKEEVLSRVGAPMTILWSISDGVLDGAVSFEFRGGQWVSVWTSRPDVPNGRTISSLPSLRKGVAREFWNYSRSCAPDESRRVRRLMFVGDRVAERIAGVYYD